MPSSPRNPALSIYPFRTEIVLTLQGIEGMIDEIQNTVLVASAESGCEPEDLGTPLGDAIEECDRIALAANCLKGRIRSENGYR